MILIKHVLVATDFSEPSGAALNYGRELARTFAATLHVLHGRIRLSSADDSVEAGTGELLAIPDARHALEALDDAVVLLTVAKSR